MKKSHLIITLLLLLGLLAPFGSLQAQEPGGWELVLGMYSQPTFVIVTPNRVQSVPLPESIPPSRYTAGAILDAEARNAVLAADFQQPALIVNLVTWNCCHNVALPEGYSYDNVITFRPGVFNATGTQFAGVYLLEVPGNPNAPWQAYLVTANIADGRLSSILPLPNDSPLGVPQITAWQGTQLTLQPSCYACEPPLSGTFYTWNLDMNNISPTEQVFDVFGDRRPSDQALLVSERDEQYPVSNEASYVPPRNVIRFYPNGRVGETPTLWFQNNSYLHLGDANWVLNGQAYLFNAIVGQNTLWFVGTPDGSILPAPSVQPNSIFVSSTPSGWVMLTNSGEVDHYVLQNGVIQRQALVQMSDLSQQPVRYSPNSSPLTNRISIREQESNSANCPSWLLPPRLTIGGRGRVTPGPANNFRASPAQSATLLGQIPGSGEFNVVGGPVCADGFRYWQVSYNGVVGWTAEGGEGDYWLEPLQ